MNFAVTEERIQRFRQSSYFMSLATSRKRKDIEGKTAELFAGENLQSDILQVLGNLKAQFAQGQLIKDRKAFEKLLKQAFKSVGVECDKALLSALVADKALGEKDPTAEPCVDKNGKPEPDADLRDTENVPLQGALLANGQRDVDNPLLALPLPLDYEGASNKGKVDKSKLLDLVRDHCQAYLVKEVLPYRADAWIDFDKVKVGYEIPLDLLRK